MEALVFWLLAGVVLVYMVRRTKRKTREIEAEAVAHAKASSLKQLQGENRQSARDAMSSKQWKQRAKKAKAKAMVKSVDVVPQPTRLGSTSSDRYLRFVYEDSQGNVTAREVSSWHDDGTYIEGYCHKAREVRTFRRDRVVEFLEGEELLGPLQVDPCLTVSRVPIEILFTGFSAGRRKELEALAEEMGLTVRKTVTNKLFFLCAGPKAGASKLSTARLQGSTILSEDEFRKLLATGEVPA